MTTPTPVKIAARAVVLSPAIATARLSSVVIAPSFGVLFEGPIDIQPSSQCARGGSRFQVDSIV